MRGCFEFSLAELIYYLYVIKFLGNIVVIRWITRITEFNKNTEAHINSTPPLRYLRFDINKYLFGKFSKIEQ